MTTDLITTREAQVAEAISAIPLNIPSEVLEIGVKVIADLALRHDQLTDILKEEQNPVLMVSRDQIRKELIQWLNSYGCTPLARASIMRQIILSGYVG